MLRLENARKPEDMPRVVACLVEWLRGPEHDSLRHALVVCLKPALLPARAPGVEIPASIVVPASGVRSV